MISNNWTYGRLLSIHLDIKYRKEQTMTTGICGNSNGNYMDTQYSEFGPSGARIIALYPMSLPIATIWQNTVASSPWNHLLIHNEMPHVPSLNYPLASTLI